MVAQVLTANRLIDGDVVYWHAGGWVESLSQADVFAEEEHGKAAVAEAQRFVTGNVVVNPYLFDVRAEADGLYPVKEREIIRAMGPSVHLDLGKQAQPTTAPPKSLHRPPPGALRASTSPQGGGEGDDDVSI